MSLARNLVRRAIAPIVRWAATPAYDAASQSRRVRGWEPGNDSVMALVAGAGDDLRRKSRDVIRRNPWAGNAVDAFVANAIGTGITPASKHPDRETRKVLESLFLRWTDECDAAGLTDFYGLQSLACREMFEAGEAFVRFRPRRASDGLTVPLQLQLVESEQVPTSKNESLAGGFKIRAGVETDPIGRRVAYHMYREHPGDILNTGGFETTRVPADQVAHLFRPLRFGQYRGQPWMTSVMVLLNDLEKYDGAELIRKQIAAMMAFFIEDADPANPLFANEDEDDDGVPIAGIEPGSVITLPNGKTVKISEPTDVGGMYVEYMRLQLRKVAAGLGITYEQLTGDMTQVNFSSLRAGLLEFRRRMEAFQHQVVVFQLCRPVWREFILAAATAGLIDIDALAADPRPFFDVEWRPQAWPWVDPLKDIAAEITARKELLKSDSEIIRSTGRDPETVFEEIAADQQRQRDLGIEKESHTASATAQDANSNGSDQNAGNQ